MADDRSLKYLRRAGEQALRLHAYDQAIIHFEGALALLQPDTDPDGGANSQVDRADTDPPTEGERAQLQLLLARAACRAGHIERAKQAVADAVAEARRLGSGTLLAQAALAMRRADTAGPDPQLCALLEEAGTALGASDPGLAARVDAHFARELALSGAWERSDALSRAAVATARGLGDLPTLAVTLANRCQVLRGPWQDEERVALSAELLDRAQQMDDPELLLEAHHVRIADFLALADRPAFEGEIRAAHRASEALGQPYYLWWSRVWRSMRSNLVGEYGRGKRLAADAYAIGNRVHPRTARVALTLQTIVRLWQQGEPTRLFSLVEGFASEHGQDYPECRVGRIWALAIVGRTGDASRELAALAAADFDLLAGRSPAIAAALLAEACTVLSDATYAALLYERLRPYAGHMVVLGPAFECLGPADRYLGLLATLRQDWGTAETHFARSLEISRRLAAPPFIARTLQNHGVMLWMRGRREDYARAEAMLADALTAAHRFEMATVAHEARQAQLRLFQATPGFVSSPSVGADEYSLTREGDIWTFCYRGTICRIRDLVGVRHLAMLLERPHQGVAADQFDMAAPAGGTAPPPDSGTRPASKRRTPESLSPAQRARVRVTRALRDAIDRICLANVSLGQHLVESVRTGAVCSYAPADGSTWIVVRG